MTELIADPSKGLTFHWTAQDGSRYVLPDGGLRESQQASEIARRVSELICGHAPSPAEIRRKVQSGDLSLEDKTRIDLFHDVKTIATEALLRDKSIKEEVTNG